MFSQDGPVYVIAELSGNHNNDFARAEAIVRAAADAGADAVKLQTYTADTITIDCKTSMFMIDNDGQWSGRSLHDLYQEASTPWDWQPRLKTLAESLGMECFSSPFDTSAVDFLESIDVPAYKIASFEITDIPLIEYCAATGKPIILSTGIASLADIEEAVAACERVGNDRYALLKCTSSYPALPEDANLNTIAHLADTFKCVAGLSDHTLGIAVPITAVGLGAKVVEKHLTLDRADGGVDSTFSLEPAEFKTMVDAIRIAEKALGSIDYAMTEKKLESRNFSRSLFVSESVQQGDLVTTSNVRSVRPGYGLPPKHLPAVLGKRFRCSVEKGTPMSFNLVE